MLFKKKKFPIPFILELKAHIPYAGINKSLEKYYELSIASFFKTSSARADPAPKKRVRRKRRYRNRFGKKRRRNKNDFSYIR